MNDENLAEVYADIIGPDATPYEKGLYRIVLKMPEDFPKTAPKGYFLTKIFHPNISDKGDICVNTLKKDWDPMNWSLRHILKVVHCLLINPFPESALNEEAGKIFMENYEQYFKRAKIFNEIHALPKQTKPKLVAPVAQQMEEVDYSVITQEFTGTTKENLLLEDGFLKGNQSGPVLTSMSSNQMSSKVTMSSMIAGQEKPIATPVGLPAGGVKPNPNVAAPAANNKKKWNKMI